MAPDFVVLGHLTRDEHPDGDRLGGAATFAAVAARNLGYRTAILTRAASDYPTPELLHDIEIVRLDSPTTTTFRNDYQQGKRQQYVRNVAAPIGANDIPDEWRSAKIVLIGSVAREISSSVVHGFSSETLIGVGPQGWMRQWDETGRVRPRAWIESGEILPHIGALVLSEEDLGQYHEHLQTYVGLAPLVALTRGEHGCIIYQNSAPPLHVPAFPAQVVDPTGAGDTFTTAFLIRFHETKDPLESARFANAAASLAIESHGAATLPTRLQVQQRMRGL